MPVDVSGADRVAVRGMYPVEGALSMPLSAWMTGSWMRGAGVTLISPLGHGGGFGRQVPVVASPKEEDAPSLSSSSSSSSSKNNDGNSKKTHMSWSQISKSLLAGGVAGSVSRTAVAPLERLKILMQVQGNDKVYTGVWQGTRHMWRQEGMRGLFKGNGLNCIRIFPNQAIKFMSYEQLSRRISHYLMDRGEDGTLTPLWRLGAGSVAGVIGMSATYWMDMVRGRISIQEGTSGKTATKTAKPTTKGTVKAPQYTGMVHATRSIVAEEGILALWRGWLPSVIGVMPYVGLNFSVYESLKEYLIRKNEYADERDLSIFTKLSCGAVAGTAGQTVAYPFDTVRRRMQVSGWAGAQTLHAEGGHAVAYKGMVDCFVRTSREEGVGALFKGLVPNYVKVVPSIAIAFVTYEQVKDFLGAELRLGSG